MLIAFVATAQSVAERIPFTLAHSALVQSPPQAATTVYTTAVKESSSRAARWPAANITEEHFCIRCNERVTRFRRPIGRFHPPTRPIRPRIRSPTHFTL